MRQIEDSRAPFATIDEALEVGHQHMRQLGWFPMGMIAEEQPGGYFVRIAGSTAVGKGGRAGRKRHQQHVAEVGKIERGPVASIML